MTEQPERESEIESVEDFQELETEPKLKTESELMQDFLSAYNNLCKEHGYIMESTPSYVPRDDGTFSTVLQNRISKLPTAGE